MIQTKVITKPKDSTTATSSGVGTTSAKAGNKTAYAETAGEADHSASTAALDSALQTTLDNKYLRKDQDDATEHKLSMAEADITGDASIGGNASITGDATIDGGATIGDDATIGGDATIDGGATIGGTLGVTGKSTLQALDIKQIATAFDMIQSNGFVDSMSTGKGWGVDASGNMQVESLEVRSALRVLELVYNRLSAEESEYVFTESGTIEEVEQSGDNYLCTLKKRSDTDFHAFRKGDVLRGIVNNLTNLGGGEYYMVWMQVVDINTAETTEGDATTHANTITVSMYADSDCPSGSNHSIYPLTAPMVVQRWGNAVEPSEEAHNNDDYKSFIEQNSAGEWINRRQSCWYISSIEKRIAMLDGVDKPILSESNYAAFFGLPYNLSTFMGYTMDSLQPYLYCRGAFLQDIHYIDYNGVVMKMENPRGNWSAETAAGDTPYMNTDTYYDTVYHNNAKWQCASSNTTDEPSESSSAWVLLEEAAQGENGADGTQANLFGYDSYVRCLNGNHTVVHTDSGFAAYISSTQDAGSCVGRCLVRISNIITGNGTYSVSGYVKYQSSNGKFEVDVCDTGAKEYTLVAGTPQFFNIKVDVTNYTSDVYNFVDFELQEGVVEIYNLKIEHADNLVGDYTSYDGLAADSIPQGANLLLGTKDMTSELNPTNVTDDGYQGCKAAYAESSSSDWTNLMSQVVQLKANTWYTLSFYAKASSNDAYIGSQMSVSDYESYDKLIVCNGEYALYVTKESQPQFNHKLTTEWTLHSMTFQTNAAQSGAVFRIYNSKVDGYTTYLSMPKLEEGQKPTTWQQSEDDRKGEQGIQGIQGEKGANGKTYYTWVKYADDANGTNMSDYPSGKAYLGIAYNKTTATESTTASDYTWSKIVGEQGIQGPQGNNGTTTYTWIKYSDVASPTSSQIYDTPTDNTKYIGIAVNKTTATESTTPTDYTWSRFKGADGDSALISSLTNELDSYACNSSGVTTSAQTVSTTFEMYYGSTLQTLTELTATSSNSLVTPTCTASSGLVSCSVATSKNIGSTSIVITITGKCTINGVEKNLTADFTIKPVLAGASPTIYNLQPTLTSIKIDKDGNYAETALTCSVSSHTGTTTKNNIVLSAYKMYMSIDGADEIAYAAITLGTTYSPKKSVQYTLYTSSSKSVLVDKQTIPVVIDGAKGEQGIQGEAGVNGADGVQPNLFGYDTEVISCNNVLAIVHTSNGFGGFAKNTQTTSSYHCAVDIVGLITSGKKYAISCSVTSPVSGTVAISFGGNSVVSKSITANTALSVYGKATAGSSDSGYIRIQVTPSSGYAYTGVFNVSNLKVEDATNLNGTYTPFAGLASDSITQRPNILLDACFRNSSKWGMFAVTKQANLLQGITGCYWTGTLAASAEINLIQQDLSGKLKTDTYYTLSYWALCSASGMCIKTFIYPSVGNESSIRIVDDKIYQGASDNYAYIGDEDDEDLTTWERHIVTIKTASSLPSTYQVLWRLKNYNSSSVTSTFYICMPKLEECEKATDWQLNEEDRRGAALRGPSEWDEDVTYLSGSDGEEWIDVVSHPDYPNELFLCKVTHSGVEPSSSTIKQQSWDATHPWTNSDVKEFVATKFLLSDTIKTQILTAVNAQIDQLTVRTLTTSGSGLHTDIYGGTFKIVGTNGNAGIRIEMDETGTPRLVFYDSSGNKLYDLGPRGISEIKSCESSFSAVTNMSIQLTGTYLTKDGLDDLIDITKGTFYLFAEGYTYSNNTKIYYISKSSIPSDYNNKIYTNNVISGDAPTRDDVKIEGYFAVTTDSGAVVDSYNLYLTVLHHYTAGEEDGSISIFWTKKNTSTVYTVPKDSRGYVAATYDSDGNNISTTTSLLKLDSSKVS